MFHKKTYFDKKSILDDLLISFSFSFVLLFFAPLDFLYGSINELWIDFYNVFGGVLTVSVIGFAFIFLLLYIMSPFLRISFILKFFLVYICVSFYVQGNFIPVPYGNLDGTPITWNDYWLADITSVMAWIGIGALMIVVYYKVREKRLGVIYRWILLSLCFITAFTLIIEYIVGDGSKKKIDKMSSTKNEWLYSRDKNINILLFDYFDSRLLTEGFEDEEIREILKEYDGFTFFRDTLGCYNLTDYSIPVILTGELYLGQSTYGDYANDSYIKSPFLERLKSEKWNTNIYTTITLPQGEISDMFSNVRYMRMKPILERKLIEDYYGIVAFRYAPTPMKRYFYDCFFEVGANKMAAGSLMEESEESYVDDTYNWRNIIWHNGSTGEYEFTEQDVFHFYHVMGVHPPRQYYSDYSFESDPSKVTMQEAAKLNLKMASEWIQKLKAEGIYDDSIIIIMADHGSWEYEDGHALSQTPLLMIKGYEERHSFFINDTMPVSYLDLQEVFQNLMNGDKSIDSFLSVAESLEIGEDRIKRVETVDQFMSDINKGEIEPVGRCRPYFFTYLMNEMGSDSVGGPFYAGYTEYPAYESDYMINTGIEYGYNE